MKGHGAPHSSNWRSRSTVWVKKGHISVVLSRSLDRCRENSGRAKVLVIGFPEPIPWRSVIQKGQAMKRFSCPGTTSGRSLKALVRTSGARCS